MTTPGRYSNETLGKWALLGLGLAAIVVALFFWPQQEADEKPLAGSPAVETPAAEPTETIENPIGPVEKEDAPALPPLAESDETAVNTLAGLVGPERVGDWFSTDDLVRRFVVTVDNLPREKLALRLRPLKPVAPPFLASGVEDAPEIGASGFARYEPYVRAAEAVDLDRVAAAYRRLYPLFQQAYEELGNPTAYFNDRLVAVIDHLLEAPEVPAPIPLVRPNVLYEFADPALEARSTGQKTLVRMGPENAARVKAVLRQLRERISTAPGTAPAERP